MSRDDTWATVIRRQGRRHWAAQALSKIGRRAGSGFGFGLRLGLGLRIRRRLGGRPPSRVRAVSESALALRHRVGICAGWARCGLRVSRAQDGRSGRVGSAQLGRLDFGTTGSGAQTVGTLGAVFGAELLVSWRVVLRGGCVWAASASGSCGLLRGQRGWGAVKGWCCLAPAVRGLVSGGRVGYERTTAGARQHRRLGEWA